MAVSIEQARSQVEARRTEIATAQRGIQARQAALPETGTQRALRMIKGIAGVPAKQRVEAERQRLTGQREAVEQYGEQVGAYEKQIDVAATQREASRKEYAKAKEYFAEGIPSHQFSGNIKKYMDQMMVAQEYDYARGTRRAEYAEAKAKYESQIGELEKEGFKPIYGDGSLIGFEDPHAKMSIPLPKFEAHMEQYKAPGAPLVAYKDIFTGEMEYVSKVAPGPMQVPVAISATGKELGFLEQAKLQAMKPELFDRPSMAPPPSPEWTVTRAPEKTMIERIKEFPSKQWEVMTGRTPRETYGQVFEPYGRPVVSTKPGEVYVPLDEYKVAKDISRIAMGIVPATGAVAMAIPDYGPGIKDPFAKKPRVVPERWVTPPEFVPQFGTYIPPEYRPKEFRRKEVYGEPKRLFEAKRVKEAVAVGVPIGVGLAAWQAVPHVIATPLFTGMSAITTVEATKAISELEGQKIKAESKPIGISDAEWRDYEMERIAYNKEIEAAIKAQRVPQVVGAVGVGVGAAVGIGKVVKYARAPLIKRLPYKIPKPKGVEVQVRVADPLTGKVITKGVYEYKVKIPSVKAEKIARWEKWIGRKPKVVELTKAKVRQVWTPKALVEGRPGLVYETRAVKPGTLTKFLKGKQELFIKPRIMGGPSAPTTLTQIQKLPKFEQEMWRKMASEYAGRTISIKHTPMILKKMQKVSGEVITYSPLEPLGRRITRAKAITTVEPVTKITKPTDFGLVTREIPKEAPLEFFRARTIMKDITKATGAPPRAVGRMPGLEMKIIRLKEVIGKPGPSKVWGITSAKIKKIPFAKTFQEVKMALPTPLPKPVLPKMRVSTSKVIMASPKPSVVHKAMAPSLWAGKGIYERTKVEIGAGIVLGVPLALGLRVKEEPKVEVSMIPAQILRPALKPSIKVAIRPKLKLELKPTLRPLLKPVLKAIVRPAIRVAVKPALRMALRPVLKTVVKPIVRPVAKPIMRSVTRPTPPEPIKPQIPKPFIPITLKKPKPKRIPKAVVRPIRKTGYEVEVKRKGKWEDITPFALSKGEALALGRKETKAGAEVSFRLRKADGVGGTLGMVPITEAELKAEYRGRIVKGKEVKKPLTFIQKRKARIATPGEFLAITAKGIAKRKAKLGDIKW